MYKIAIIGGGANGVSVLNELVNQLTAASTEHVEISLYEKSGIFGAGLAYGTKHDAHILNMPSSTMSAVGGDPTDFHEWLKKPHEPNLHPYFNAQAEARDFVPRKIFGMYLEDLYKNALKQAEDHGINIEIFNEEALDVTENKDSVVVWSDGKSREFNQTVLCLGNQPPTFGRELKGVPGYFHHAWPEKNITDNIPNDEEVYVIGSSLTAVDVFITLQEKGHSGPIHFVSRQGVLPKVRTFAEAYDLQFLTPENIQCLTENGQKELSLEDVSQLFMKEFKAAGAAVPNIDEILSIPLDSPKEILKQDVKIAEQEHVEYFSVLKAADEVIGHVWNAISLKDRERFDAHYRTLWNAYDYPMPMQNARKILNALENGQLSVDGGFRSLEYDPKSKEFLLTCADKDKTQPPAVRRARFVINATGQGMSLEKLESPIVQNALDSGTITPHLLGGVNVDFSTGAVGNARGQYSNRIYAVGSLTRGVHFYTNSINENAKAGKNTVTQIVKNTSFFNQGLNASSEQHFQGGEYDCE